MSDVSQGPGWWQASDGKWYPPEQAPAGQPPAAAPPAYGAPPAAAPAYGGTPGAIDPGAGYGVPGGQPAYGAPAGGPPADQLADWATRVSSAAIDWIAIPVLGSIVSFSISYALGSLISLIGLAFAIYNGYLNGETGQSIGKRVNGTKVLGATTGQPIGGGAGILRYLCHIIDALACYIGFLWPLWDAQKQTFGDKIMKTVVIVGQPKESLGDAIKSATGKS